jgi:predicted NUDIX family NTP pyrophosphohydrolase
MSRPRHIARTLALLGAATACVLWSHSGSSQTDAYPARPVRVIVGLAPGGATDIQARLFAQKLSESFNRPFVVENRAGAGGTIAYALVAKSPPDGHTLVAAASGFSSTPLFYPKLPYDPFKDFAPVSLLVQAPFLLLVHPSGNYNRGKPWGIPKGLLDPGENLEQAARRETAEETGVVAGELRELGSIEYTKSRKCVHCFAGPAPADAKPQCASWEVDRAEFVPLARAREMLHPDQLPFLDRLLERVSPGS